LPEIRSLDILPALTTHIHQCERHGVMDQHISLEAVINFLVDAPLFRDLDAAERGDVARIMEVQRLERGEHVFREGDEAMRSMSCSMERPT